MTRTPALETLLNDLSTITPPAQVEPHTGTLRPRQAVWLEVFGVTLAGYYRRSDPRNPNMAHVSITIGADPFGRYTGRAWIARSQIRPRRLPWHTEGNLS